MQTKQTIRMGTIVVLIFAQLSPLLTQTKTIQDDVVITPCVEIGDNWFVPRTGASFVASWKGTVLNWVNRSDDGTLSRRETSRKQARDTAGRIYAELEGWTSNGVQTSPIAFEIFDPVKKSVISWQEYSIQAYLRHLSPGELSSFRDAPWMADAAACAATGTKQKFKMEKLGTKTILGIVAEGIRASGMILGPNSQLVPLSVERWYSSDLGITLLSILNAPRTGSETWEMTDYQRIEPNPALFQVPAKYVVKEVGPVETVVGREDAR